VTICHKNVEHETLCCQKSRFHRIVEQFGLLSKRLVKVEGSVCSMYSVNPKKYHYHPPYHETKQKAKYISFDKKETPSVATVKKRSKPNNHQG